MVTFVIVNKGDLTVQTVTVEWPVFPSKFLKENPKARVYLKSFQMDEYTEYSLDKAKRHPRLIRCQFFAQQELPAEVRTAFLLNPI